MPDENETVRVEYETVRVENETVAEQPSTVAKPIVAADALWWRCPFCGVANGTPEVDTCACGATKQPGGVAARAAAD